MIISRENKTTVYFIRRLITVFIVVVVIAGLVIGLTFDKTQMVADKADSLVNWHVPALREISDLQHVMSQRVTELYNYYATAELLGNKKRLKLRDQFDRSLLVLNSMRADRSEIATLIKLMASFEHSADKFDAEMALGVNKDWDLLREHLARAQNAAKKADMVLLGWTKQIQKQAADGASTTLNEVVNLKRLQLGFSGGVLLVSLFVLIALYSRFKDQEEIYRQAHFDSLTGLPNRRSLKRDWDLLQHSSKDSASKAILMLGLDRFQLVTGTFGHMVGDQLLASVSSWVKALLNGYPEGSEVYYFSPGVWLILVTTDSDDSAISALAEKLLTVSGIPMQFGDRQLNVSCSIGITYLSDDQDSLEELLRNADAAQRAARQTGGNSMRTYQAELNRAAEVCLSTESDMRKALNEKEFELFYQPKVRADNGGLVGAEALIRWRKDGVLVSPGVFIPIAEQSALIINLGDWVLNEACRQWAYWHKQAKMNFPIAVNVSAQQFQMPNFSASVEKVLEKYDMPASQLELEITEEAAIENPDKVVLTMRRLKKIGVTLAIDDFGTGYSSLSHLKRFPLDVLKVDRAFVCQMESSKQDRAIVHMLLALAQELGFKVVAEGVETKQQRDSLVKLGCDYFQGFYFSEPLSAQDYTNFMASRAKPGTAPKLVSS